jgi:type I restriction enzyme S subunit
MLAVTVDGEIVRREQLGRHVSDDTGPEKCLRIQHGDLAYNTMRLWQGSIGVAEEEGLLSPAYTVLRQLKTSEPGWLWVEVLRSKPLQVEYRKLVRGIAKDRWRIYFKDLATVTFSRAGLADINDLATDLALAQAGSEALRKRTSLCDAMVARIAENIA